MSATKTTVDWLRFRAKGRPETGLEALRPMYGALGPYLNLQRLERGKDGFQAAAAVRVADMVVGRLDYGGESQRGWNRWNITGTGCEWVKDWDALQPIEALPEAQIRRLDIALTTWDGQVTHEAVEAGHAGGLFCSGGRPPSMQTILNTDPRAGRTCNVGQRDADKYFRGYEKGLQLVAKMGPAGANVTHIEGHRVEDIYRCEVELKAASTEIPWEVIERRDQYFAGSYPFLAELLPDVESDILMRRPERAPQTELLTMLDNCRIQYGATLFTALTVYGGDIGAVWERIVGNRHNENLLAAGVMLVEPP
jgi:DNA relaxase NicK